MCIVIIFYPVCDVINLETKLSFLIKPFKGLSLKQIKSTFFGRWEPSIKGRLTDRAINLLQYYFEMAIRQNNDIPSMEKYIGAVLFQCSESQYDEQGPRVENNRCNWLSDKILGKETFLPSAIKSMIKPILIWAMILFSLHKTQNLDESSNGLIRNRCAKSAQ